MKQRLYYNTEQDAQKAIETITRAQKECDKFLKIEIKQIHSQLWCVTVEDNKQ
jgi:hypothetical protein